MRIEDPVDEGGPGGVEQLEEDEQDVEAYGERIQINIYDFVNIEQ